MPQKYFDPNSGEPLDPTGQLGGDNVNISDAGYGQLSLPSEVGPVYHGFGAPPQQPRALPQSQPTMDIPETPKDTFFSGLARAWDTGKSIAKGMMDPEALAGMGAGMLTASKSTPFGMAASGAATGGVAMAKDLYKRATDPEAAKQPLSASIPEVGAAFASGAIGELGARGLNAIRRPMVTPQGQAATKFFGERNIMPQQQADSAGLNFIANVAKYGPGGQAIIKEAEDKQSQQVLDHLMGISDSLNNNRGLSIDPSTGTFNAGQAGKKVQTDIAGSLDMARKNSGFDQFLQTHGKAAESKQVVDAVGNVKIVKGKTVSELQKMRSDALEMSRRADASGDVKLQQQALARAQKLGESLKKALPDQAARDEYLNLTSKYKAEMSRLDNPTVQAIREGSSDKVVDQVLDSNLKNYAPFGAAATGQTNTELLGRLQKSLSPEAWEQLQADAVHRLGERSIEKKSGQVSADKMAEELAKLDAPTQQKLFGKALPDIQKTLELVKQAQKYTKSEAGRLFISIRYGSAIMGGIGGTIGATTAAARGDSARAGAAIGGLAGAATFAVSPYAFAKLLTSSIGRRVLTRALQTNTRTSAGRAARVALTRYITQNGLEAGREAMSGSNEPVEVPDELKNFGLDGSSIPEPPQ